MSSNIENMNTQADANATPKNPDMQWYIVHTYSGYENKVKDSIDRMIANNSVQNLIESVVIPTDEEVTFDKNGKEKTEIKRRFPGYVLIKMVHNRDSWYWVRNVRGVTGFVGPDPMNPTPLTDDEVRALRIEQNAESETNYVLGINVGDKINIIAGPLVGHEGTVIDVPQDAEEIKTKGCIKAKVSMFGREITADLEYAQVEKVD